jgi:hypothetical protein
VRFPIHGGVYFGGGRPYQTPYRILCNNVQREGVKASPELASGLFCYVPLHKIWHGIPYQCATYFAKCIVCVARKLPLGVFPVRNENGYAVNYPTEPGIYKTYLWREQVEDAEIAGCDVEVIEGYYWRVLTPPTKSPPRLYSRQERTFIYALVNPLTHKAFYVGETYKPEQRLIRHLHDTRNPWKFERVQQLHAQGHFPLLMILEEVDYAVFDERENWWRAYYCVRGHNLTNGCCQRLKKSSMREVGNRPYNSCLTHIPQ